MQLVTLYCYEFKLSFSKEKTNICMYIKLNERNSMTM